MNQAIAMPVEAVLREELVHGDIVLGTVAPILGHLLANHDHSLFSDEIVARVRGMAGHVARQLLTVQGEVQKADDPVGFAAGKADHLASAFLVSPAFLAHCHALALESQLTGRLERQIALDPVLSPLLQSLIASDDAATASSAMAALAAQARFVQQQQRMELPLAELPGDQFHHAVSTWRARASDIDEVQAGEVEQALRSSYDEGSGRLGLQARLVSGMGTGARAALSVAHAGASLFLSALAAATNQERDLVVIATNESQLARLALSLRAAGLKPDEIEEQFIHIHPEVALPEGFETLRTDRAAAMLAAAPSPSGS